MSYKKSKCWQHKNPHPKPIVMTPYTNHTPGGSNATQHSALPIFVTVVSDLHFRAKHSSPLCGICHLPGVPRGLAVVACRCIRRPHCAVLRFTIFPPLTNLTTAKATGGVRRTQPRRATCVPSLICPARHARCVAGPSDNVRAGRSIHPCFSSSCLQLMLPSQYPSPSWRRDSLCTRLVGRGPEGGDAL